MRTLLGRIERAERELAPAADWQAWWPIDDESDERTDLVRNVRTGEVAHPDDVRARNGRDIIVRYVDEADRRAP